MARMLRLAALGAASAAALFAGLAFGLAQEKERIGIDNAEKCDMSMRDPDCNNDTLTREDIHLVPFPGEPDSFVRSEDNRREDRHESQG